jgi:GT2 family glycosyltransferase
MHKEVFKCFYLWSVYGKQRGVESSVFSEIQIFKKWFPEESVPAQKDPFCNNANAAIRKRLWEKDKYDETLTGLEDLDWAKRVLKNGGVISYAADAEVSHVHDETSRGTYNRYKREGIAYGKIFPKQRFSFLDFSRLFIGNMVSDYRFAFIDKKLIKNLASIPRFRFLQFFGTYVGRNFHDEVDRDVMNRFYYPRKPFRRQDGKV